MTELNVKLTYKALINNLGNTRQNRITQWFITLPFTSGKFNRHAQYLYSRMEAHFDICMLVSFVIMPQQVNIQIMSPINSTQLLSMMELGWRMGTHYTLAWTLLFTMTPVLFWTLRCCAASVWFATRRKITTLNGRMECLDDLTKPRCHKTYDGNSGVMEAETARILRRSTQNNLWYTMFINDGASSTHQAICEMNIGQGPYDVPVLKEKCVNYVSKRPGTRLQKMKQDFFIITPKTGRKMKWSVFGGAKKVTNYVTESLQAY